MKLLTENDILDFRNYIAEKAKMCDPDEHGGIGIDPEIDAVEVLAIVDLALKAERYRQLALVGWESTRALAIAGLHRATEHAANEAILTLNTPDPIDMRIK